MMRHRCRHLKIMIATRKSNQGLVERSLHRPYSLLPSGRYSTSLTPYGASFWALILAACGGGGGGGGGSSPVVSNPPRDPVDDGGGTPVSSNPPPTSGTMSLSGKVIDGPVEGASLFLLRPTHINSGPVKVYVGTSRRDGTYEVSAERRFADYILYADLANAIDHGEDLTSDTDNIKYEAGDYWRAPSGSAIISPLTEILGRIYGFSPTPAQKAAFSERLGLPTEIDVTRDDPLSADMAPYRQQLFLLGKFTNQALSTLGDAPLNAGNTGQAYIDEINRLYAQKTQTPDKEPPSPEQPQQVAPAQPPPVESSPPADVNPPDIDDPPTALRATISEPNKGYAIDSREQSGRGGRIHFTDLIVDDPDTKPEFRNWRLEFRQNDRTFKLVGHDDHVDINPADYIEIDGLGLYLRAGVTSPTREDLLMLSFTVGIVGTDLMVDVFLAVTGNVNSYGPVRIDVRPQSDGTGLALVADTSGVKDGDNDVLTFSYQWERIGLYQRDGASHPQNLPTTQMMPLTENGHYRLIVTAYDKVPGYDKVFETEQRPVIIVVNDPSLPGYVSPEPATPPAGMTHHKIYENHPLTLPVYEFSGEGRFALAPGGRDNAMFRIEADTGKLWFVPQAGYRVLNYENPQDIGRDNIYEIRIARTDPDGRVDHESLALTVRDIVPELYGGNKFVRRNEDGKFEAWNYKFTWSQVRDLINARDDWTAEEKTYAGWLLDGEAWVLPIQGPLIITWGINTRKWVYKWANPDGLKTKELVPATDEEIAAYRAEILPALQKFEETINVKFIEAASFGTSRGANYPLLEFRLKENDTTNNGGGPGPGSYVALHKNTDLDVILHELGHAFGLSHPFFDPRGGDHQEEGAFPRSMARNEIDFIIKTGFDSVMGYFRPNDRNLTQKDINVLQLLYGAPGSDYRGLQSLIDDLEFIAPTPPDWL